LRLGFFGDALKNFWRIKLSNYAAGLADQQGCWLALVGMGTGYECIAAFDLVDEAVGQEKIKGAVNRNGRWAGAVFRHPFDDVIGANGRMALGDGTKNFAALAGQFAAAPLAGAFGPRNKVSGAMGVIMVGVKEGHAVII
jgi:hypothetical protein